MKKGEVPLERALSKPGLASRSEAKAMIRAGRDEVTRLKRVSFGGLDLGDLQPGQWRVVGAEELRVAFQLPRV